jgi:type IV pilus assembly protein PilX
MLNNISVGIKNQQNGAALITALVFLVILTMLALGSMNTSTLEEKMAANSQEINRAFQTAESGLEVAFDDPNSFSITNTETNPYTGTVTDFGTYDADATYEVAFRQATSPKRGSGWDSNYASYHFDVGSSGATDSGAGTTIHAGAYQIGYK